MRNVLEGLAILVVEDDLPSTKLLRVVLEAEGCRVQVSSSAEEALDALRTFQPRVIVVDLVLPLMSGLVLAQRLKANAATKDIVLLAVTSFNGPEAELMVLEAGFARYIRKPIDPARFVAALVSTLRGLA
jgi:DNA-binding response OmpR family regulator